METSKWKKGDEMVDGAERRTFTFLAENKNEKELWLFQIRCVEFPSVGSDMYTYTRYKVSVGMCDEWYDWYHWGTVRVPLFGQDSRDRRDSSRKEVP